jgi:hypothetical protein
MTASPPDTREWLAICFEFGAVLWDGQYRTYESFAHSLSEPIAGFTRGGRVVAASRQEIEVYDTQGGQLHLRARVTGNREQPIGVLSLPQSDQFAVAYTDGKLLVYGIE